MDAPRCEVLGESGESGESSGQSGSNREALGLPVARSCLSSRVFRVAFALHLDEVEGLREEALRAATGLLVADSSPGWGCSLVAARAGLTSLPVGDSAVGSGGALRRGER